MSFVCALLMIEWDATRTIKALVLQNKKQLFELGFLETRLDLRMRDDEVLAGPLEMAFLNRAIAEVAICRRHHELSGDRLQSLSDAEWIRRRVSLTCTLPNTR